MKISALTTAVTIAVLGRNVAATEEYETATNATQDSICVRTAELNSPTSGYFAAFGTDEPSRKLFQRNGSLSVLAPIINVAKEALNQPIPTNKWWGNLIHFNPKNKSENYPAWASPYSVKLPREFPFGLQTYYPYTYRTISPEVNGIVREYSHGIHNDLTLSAREFKTKPEYEIYSWDDMGVNLRICGPSTGKCMYSTLLNGMAFVSAKYDGLTPRIDTEHNITFVDNPAPGKFVVHLSNNQTWVLYASDKSISFHVVEPVAFSVNASGSSLVADCGYSGTIRVAVLPEKAKDTIYDKFAPCMVRGGVVSMESRTAYSIHWEVEGSTCESVGLLHFALPHQVDQLTGSRMTATTPGAILLHSATRGLMVGQVLNTWSFVEPEAEFEIDFYPARRPSPSIVKKTKMLPTLQNDIVANWTMNARSWYFNGKLFQKYAMLCLMAADSSVVGSDTTLLALCLKKLEALIEPLLNNTQEPPLVYETVYRGIISSAIFITGDLLVDFGQGIFNDLHYHLGYYLVAGSVIRYLDPNWSRMPELESIIWIMLRNVANPSRDDCFFPRFRSFSWFNAHSYSRGVLLSDQGKDEESTSEDFNFHYGMTLWGKATGNKALEDLGNLMARLNARAIRTYFLMTSDNTIHSPEIVRNHVTGIFFDNRVYYNTWFSNMTVAIHGIQKIPATASLELAHTYEFVKQEWVDILSKDPVVAMKNSSNPWLSLLLVSAAVLDPIKSLSRLPKATMDDGLCLSWALYMCATRFRKEAQLLNTPSQTDVKNFVEQLW